MRSSDSLTSPSRPDAEGQISVWRVLAVVVPLLVFSGYAIEVVDVYWKRGNIGHGVPPMLAMGLFLPLLILCALIPALRRRWSVTRGELIIIFSVLVLAMPVFSVGLWHHLPPLQIEYHRTRELARAMSISTNLWPNDGNVLAGASAEDEPADGADWAFSRPDTTLITGNPDGPGRCVQIVHTDNTDVSQLILELDRNTSPRFVRALTRYAIWVRLRLDDASPGAKAVLWAGTGPKHGSELTSLRSETKVTILAPDRFKISGRIDYQVPRDLADRFYLKLTFSGRGTLWARDFSIIDTENVYRYLEGYEAANPTVHDSLRPPERSFVRRRPPAGDLLGYARHVISDLAPWQAWARPYAAWGLLITAMFLGMFCLVTLFYRHWEQGDRLTFPLQTFIVDLTKADEHGRLSLRHSRPFWIGFGVCGLHLSLQYGSGYIPELPHLNLSLSVDDLLPAGPLKDAVRSGGRLAFHISPIAVAVAFFMSLEMSRSLVLFFLLGAVVKIFGFFTPLKTLPAAGNYEVPGYPFQNLLATGGLLYMALFCVIAARKHLWHVASKVFLGRPSIDDSGEAMSYRWAISGLAATLAMFIAFAHLAELNSLFVVVFLSILLLLALSAARIRAETGLPSVGFMVHYPQLALVGIGSGLVFGFRQITFTAQAFFLYVTFLMSAPLLAEAMAAATRTGVPLRKLGRCLIIGFAVAVVIGGLVTMSWAYSFGALNMNLRLAEKRSEYNRMTALIVGDDRLIEQHFRNHPEETPVLTGQTAKRIAQLQPVTLTMIGLSFAITGLLTLVRVIWLGFPFHPLGFALAFTPAMNGLWGSVAVAFLVKSLALRFGGVQTVRQFLRPFFVGVFIASPTVAVIWKVIDLIVRGTAE